MGIRKFIENRRRDQIDAAIADQCDQIIDYFAATRYEPSGLPTRNWNIGLPPKGISSEEFMGRIGIRASALMQKQWTPGDQYAYDLEASEQLQQERGDPEAWQIGPAGPEPPGFRIVFKRILTEGTETTWPQ